MIDFAITQLLHENKVSFSLYSLTVLHDLFRILLYYKIDPNNHYLNSIKAIKLH